jgi:hypothetical protein
MSRCRNLLRRQILLPLLAFLVLTAPINWPVYSTCILLVNHATSFSAHFAFRLYQVEDTGQPTVVNSLMFLLSLLMQMAESNSLAIILLKLLAEEWSLSWYQNNPQLSCLVLFPRYPICFIQSLDLCRPI